MIAPITPSQARKRTQARTAGVVAIVLLAIGVAMSFAAQEQGVFGFAAGVLVLAAIPFGVRAVRLYQEWRRD